MTAYRTLPVIVIGAIIAIGLRAKTPAMEGEISMSDPSSQAYLQPDLLAAFLVSYEDYKLWRSSRGEKATPSSLRQKHRAITLSADRDTAHVTFGAPSFEFGGGITYTIDLERMVVLKREFTR